MIIFFLFLKACYFFTKFYKSSKCLFPWQSIWKISDLLILPISLQSFSNNRGSYDLVFIKITIFYKCVYNTSQVIWQRLQYWRFPSSASMSSMSLISWILVITLLFSSHITRTPSVHIPIHFVRWINFVFFK